MNSGIYHFDLSLAELHWLAGALGISSLPLPDETFGGLTPPQLEERQKNGHASLLTRGLIRPSPGFGWQVERLPAALLQWIASAPSLLRLECISKDGRVRRVHLFTMNDQGLSLEMDGETVHFILYEKRALLRDAALRWLALPTVAKKSTTTHDLPQPLTFLPAAWNDSTLATRILKERGVNAKHTKATLVWVASLEWVTALSKVQLEGQKNSILNQFVLCGNEKNIWEGEDNLTKVSFLPVATKGLNATMDKLL
jgi:hypothetical protein